MHACMRYVDRRAFDKLTTSDVGRDAMNRFIILFVIVIIYMVMIHSRRWRILIIGVSDGYLDADITYVIRIAYSLLTGTAPTSHRRSIEARVDIDNDRRVSAADDRMFADVDAYIVAIDDPIQSSSPIDPYIYAVSKHYGKSAPDKPHAYY